MTDHSTFDNLPDEDLRRVRELLDGIADQTITSLPPAHDNRYELLRRLLGTQLCKRLGIFRIPEGFRISVVVPVFNEVETIERVIERLESTGLPLEIILIDDGSSDGTRDVLTRLENQYGVRVCFHGQNQGKGAAIRTGLKKATGDVVVIQDADLEYDPHDFWWMLQPIIENRANVVYGSRFAKANRPVSPLIHYWACQLITCLANLFLGKRLTDVETCYKMFRRELIESVVDELQEDRFGIEIELTFRVGRQSNARFYEVPISYDRRSYAEGKKIGWKDGVAALWCILRYGITVRKK